jgi:hypothetical protein
MEEATVMFKEINSAYQAITNPTIEDDPRFGFGAPSPEEFFHFMFTQMMFGGRGPFGRSPFGNPVFFEDDDIDYEYDGYDDEEDDLYDEDDEEGWETATSDDETDNVGWGPVLVSATESTIRMKWKLGGMYHGLGINLVRFEVYCNRTRVWSGKGTVYEYNTNFCNSSFTFQIYGYDKDDKCFESDKTILSTAERGKVIHGELKLNQHKPKNTKENTKTSNKTESHIPSSDPKKKDPPKQDVEPKSTKNTSAPKTDAKKEQKKPEKTAEKSESPPKKAQKVESTPKKPVHFNSPNAKKNKTPPKKVVPEEIFEEEEEPVVIEEEEDFSGAFAKNHKKNSKNLKK